MKTTIGTWKGQPIEKLTKEELSEVVKFMVGEIEEQRKEKEFLGDDYYDLLVRKKLTFADNL